MMPSRLSGSCRRRSLQGAIALGVFGSALAVLLGGIWAQGPTRVVPTAPHPIPETLLLSHGVDAAIDLDVPHLWARFAESDHRFAVWATAHAARSLLEAPTALFDARSCHPAPNSLAYGHPLITFGLLGAPAFALTQDPVATYNLALFISALAAAFAMALLVFDWTGQRTAALVAGLLFAFHSAKLGDAVHAYLLDTSWAVLAFFFARRFFVDGRLRDAVGGAIAVSLQIGGGFYSLLASCLVGIPVLAWLIAANGFGAIRLRPLLVFLAIVGSTIAVVMGPYLTLQQSPESLEHVLKLHRSWSRFVPGAWLGWTPLAFAIAALALRGGGLREGIRGDPRPFLVGAAAIGAWFATGGNVNAQIAAARAGDTVLALPNPYAGLATLVPGLSSVRVPALLESSVHLSVSILAGLGAAALLARVPQRFAAQVRVGLVIVVWLVVARPAALGFTPAVAFEPLQIRPDPALLEFHAVLERAGDVGPLLELPVFSARIQPLAVIRASTDQLLSSYHGRRTSSCYNSHEPEITAEVAKLGQRAPHPAALDRLFKLGFRTIILNHRDPRGPGARRFARAAAQPESRLERLHADGARTAYRIRRVDSVAGRRGIVLP